MDTSIKELAKEAKERIKNGYWQKSKEELEKSLKLAKNNGLNESKVVEFYREKVKSDILGGNEDDAFYLKVKEILTLTL